MPLSFLLIGLIVAGGLVALAWVSKSTTSLQLLTTRKKLEKLKEEHREELQGLRNELLILAHSFDTEPSYTNMEAYELELKLIQDKLIKLSMSNKQHEK